MMALVAAFTATALVAAQRFPNRPLRIIVTSAPGGGSDLMARAAAQRLSESLGQAVVVENRPGIAAQVGNEFGMGLTPDGYTMTIVTPSYTINPTVRASKFDPLTSYTPIIMVAKRPVVVLTHPSVAARNAQELVAIAKNRPGELASRKSASNSESTDWPMVRMERLRRTTLRVRAL